MISGGAGAAPTEPMNAWSSGSAKKSWNCSMVSHSSMIVTNPSPIPNRW